MTGPADQDRDEHPFFDAMRQQILATPLTTPRRPRVRVRHIRTWLAVRPWAMAGAWLAFSLAVSALIITLVAGAGQPQPAYAVTTTSSTVEISLSRGDQPRAMAELNARLAFLHTRIRVVPIIEGCVAPVHVAASVYGGIAFIAPGPPRTLEVDRVGPPGSGTHFAVALGQDVAPPKTILILPITRSGKLSVTTPVVIGPTPRCVGLHAP